MAWELLALFVESERAQFLTTLTAGDDGIFCKVQPAQWIRVYHLGLLLYVSEY